MKAEELNLSLVYGYSAFLDKIHYAPVLKP